jgi:predicted extracellular nuclease
LILDDDDNRRSRALSHSDPNKNTAQRERRRKVRNKRSEIAASAGIYHPPPGFSATNRVRVGDVYLGLTGLLHWSWAGAKGTENWRLRPAPELYSYQPERAKQAATVPVRSPGILRVVSFNLWNYFHTVSKPGSRCGPRGLACRGAHSRDERRRQLQKLVVALCELAPDIAGLVEVENDAGKSLSRLVKATNKRCGPYSAIATGFIGTDAIKSGLIYRPDAVAPVGQFAIQQTDDFVRPNGGKGGRNRPALVQKFVAKGVDWSSFTLVVNHLKSKRNSCGRRDGDRHDGQGSCSRTRTQGVEAQVRWLRDELGVSGQSKVLLIGDLNAYRNERPLQILRAAGYVDVIDKFVGEDAYTYVHRGESGYLDHALASEALLPHVVAVAIWHINSGESALLDYNDDKRQAGERNFERKPAGLEVFAPDAIRSSDHDPVVIDLRFER